MNKSWKIYFHQFDTIFTKNVSVAVYLLYTNSKNCSSYAVKRSFPHLIDHNVGAKNNVAQNEIMLTTLVSLLH